MSIGQVNRTQRRIILNLVSFLDFEEELGDVGPDS